MDNCLFQNIMNDRLIIDYQTSRLKKLREIFLLHRCQHINTNIKKPLEDRFFLFTLQKDVIARSNHCASSRYDEIRSDDKQYVGEKSTQFLPPNLFFDVCQMQQLRTPGQKRVMLNKNLYFYLITCNSCVPRQNLVFPVALIHLRLSYWLYWRAKN